MASSGVARAVDRAQAIRRVKGVGGLVRRGIEKPLERVASTIDYYRYRGSYPVNVIFVASLPKSGSTWVANMLASLDGFRRQNPSGWRPTSRGVRNHDLYGGMLKEFHRALAVVKGHTNGTAGNAGLLAASGLPYVLTVRDPRDTLISAYWHIRNDKTHVNHSYARSLELAEWLWLESDTTTAREHPASWLRGWMEHRDVERSMVVRYEDLIAETSPVFRSLLEFLGIDHGELDVDGIIETNSFEAVTGRKRGEQNTESFVRKGSPGEWRDLYDEGLRRRFAASSEDIVEAFGYEPTL